MSFRPGTFLLGFLCPIIWYVAALLYCCKYYNRDPRERTGLAASAVLAVIITAVTIVTLSVLLICCVNKRFLNSCAVWPK
ncbi:Ribosomal protein L18ae family [Zea mays]|uniref:Ribosomal protein L18ae family n=1 Tax=Zea mays TaxID=4577 RepID=A0A1D6FN93_MAIZE|nr:Ribosomal protein L18ae family [Zea mays]